MIFSFSPFSLSPLCSFLQHSLTQTHKDQGVESDKIQGESPALGDPETSRDVNCPGGRQTVQVSSAGAGQGRPPKRSPHPAQGGTWNLESQV